MTVAETLRIAAKQLADVSDAPRLDAELLMAHALGVSRSDLLLNKMQGAAPHSFGPLLSRRMAYEPLAYITGTQEFWGLDLHVSPDVLIPRGDTETLIEAAIDVLKGNPPQRILDLGTGSGALLLAALSHWPDAAGVGIDQSEAALKIAQGNAQSLDMADRADLQKCDWRRDGWMQRLNGPFDLILCNPPYVETAAKLEPNVRDYEPHDALFAGAQGLDDYTLLIPQLHHLRAADAPIIFEIGAGQGLSVAEIAHINGYKTTLRHDLAGLSRALILR